MRRRRTNPFLCRACRSWFDEADAGVSRGELADSTPYVLCGECSRTFAASSGAECQQLAARIRETTAELSIV